jgi:hypothetical protein
MEPVGTPTPASVPPAKPETTVPPAVMPKQPAQSKNRGDVGKVTQGSALALRRLVVTRAINEREPLAGDQFSAGSDPVFAFLEINNPSEQNQSVVVTFEHEGGAKVGNVALEIPANQRRWRTWGRTSRIHRGGEWIAVVRTPDGQELGRTRFLVSAG